MNIPAVDMVTIVSTGFAPTPLATAVVDTAVVVVVVADVVPPPDSDVGSGAAGMTSHFGTSTINVNSFWDKKGSINHNRSERHARFRHYNIHILISVWKFIFLQ